MNSKRRICKEKRHIWILKTQETVNDYHIQLTIRQTYSEDNNNNK